MASTYLTKSDFKACLDCRTKLFYRKAGYPSTMEDNEYLRLLADGGFMVEFIAKAKFPGGIDLAAERNPRTAFSRTREILTGGDATIFEAGVIADKFHVRTDILRREGDSLHLIEVKSSSLGEKDDWMSPFLNKAEDAVLSKWQEYVMDVAFQTHVLRLAFPKLKVIPHLCVVDKRQRVTAAETLDRFVLQRNPENPKARPEIVYRGNAAELAQSKVVCLRSVEREVALVMGEVVARAIALAELLTPSGVTHLKENIADKYRECRTCEYRVPQTERSGFRQCWGSLADATPHILDLHRVSQVATKDAAVDPVRELIARGRASLLDLEPTDLGSEGARQRRRLMQWESFSSGGAEHLPASIKRELMSHHTSPGWPLHFIDFEACNVALPHHPGMRPYERVAFQWSCHTVHSDGEIAHAEWLNMEREFPNFAFALSLKEQLGETGTVYVWSPYEQSTLRNILGQIHEWLGRNIQEAVRVAGLTDPTRLDDLAEWLERLLGPEDKKGERSSPRIRDMHKLAEAAYFHPRMGGRTSIKVVLPAVWENNPKLWQHPEFSQYFQSDGNGGAIDPYKTLPAWPLGDAEPTEEEAIREGTGAVRAYQDMIFSEGLSENRRLGLRRLLLQYCRLDTAAMLVIWSHWVGAAPTSRSQH